MNYGMWISASSVSVNMARQDVMSNNLANVGTAGFKPDSLAVRARDVVRVEDNLPFEDSSDLLERLGAGIMPVPTRTSFSQGPTEQTGRPLDLAIEGAGFLSVENDAAGGTVLTRDGRLAISERGELVQASTGSPILSPGGGRISIDRGATITIRDDGEVLQNGVAVGQLALLDADASALRKFGQGLFVVDPGASGAVRAATTSSLVQGAVEGSSVDPIKAMMGVSAAGRATQGGMRMIGIFNQNLDALINRFGRLG